MSGPASLLRKLARYFAKTSYEDAWEDSPDWCARCGNELLDAADEEWHYSEGLCSWCSYQWHKEETSNLNHEE